VDSQATWQEIVGIREANLGHLFRVTDSPVTKPYLGIK